MRCDQVLELLIEEDQESLSTDARRLLADHLSACAACRREHAQVEGVWKALATWSDIEPSSGFTQSVMTRIRVSEGDACVRCRTAFLEQEEGETRLPSEIASHLEACPQCRLERQAVDQTWDMLDAWTGMEPSPSFTVDVMRRVEKDSRASLAPLRAIGRWPRALSPVSPRLIRTVAALAAGLLMIVGVFLLMNPGPKPESPRVLDQYVRSFDAGRRVTVIEELPAYVADSTANILDDISDPSSDLATDDVLEEVLKQQHGGHG